MEVAGLALGAYAVIVLAFEQYKKGAKYISNWAQYRRKYEALIRDMEAQQLFFEGILHDLLCGGPDPFLTGNSATSKDTFMHIATDASFAGWKSPVLKQRLKTRLDSRYDWCIYTIGTIYEILLELGDLLDIQALESSDKTPDWWRYQWKRIIQTLFAEKAYEGRETVKQAVGDLKQMIELSDKQRSRGFQRTSTFAPFFKTNRDNANGLHGVLRSSWSCCCAASHNVMLRLERKIDRGEDEFNMLYVGSSNSDTEKIPKIMERGLRVQVSKQEENIAQLVIDPPVLPPISLQNAQSSPLPSTSPTPSLSTTKSYSTIPQRPPLIPKKQQRSSFRLQVSDISLSFSKKLRRKKTDKVKEIRHFEVMESMQSERVDEEQTLKNAMIVFEDSISSINSLSKKIPEIQDSRPFPKPALISDLCGALKQDNSVDSLGYLKQDLYIYNFISTPLPNPENNKITTLMDVLEAGSDEFPPEKRAMVATIIASALLQLQKTHWMSDTWSKRDILFTKHDDKIDFSQPYISQSFISTTTKIPDSPAPPPSFRPKTSLECLGILLIELCFGVPIEKWQHKVRLRPTSPGAHNHEFNLAIANTCTWEEIRAHDPLFSDPVNSCLHFPHRRGTDEIDDMYQLIARPLYEEVTRKWPPLVGEDY